VTTSTRAAPGTIFFSRYPVGGNTTAFAAGPITAEASKYCRAACARSPDVRAQSHRKQQEQQA
jgi:hypothetical protein